MHIHIRRFPALLLVLLAAAACDDDPTNPVIGLPDVLNPVSVTTTKNTAVEAFVPVTTIAGRTLTGTVTSGPSNGTVDVTQLSTGVRVRYTPNAGFAGQDRVDFQVADGVSTVDGRVDITVVNAPPSADDVFLRRPAQAPVTIQVSGSDPDGDALTFAVVDAPSGGTLSAFAAAVVGSGPASVAAATTAQVTYTPNPGFVGDETFTYRSHDGNDPSTPATVTMVANRFPSVTVDGGTPVTVRRNAPTRIRFRIADADGDEVTATFGAAPSFGTLGAMDDTNAGFDVLYTPNAGFAGDDAFTVLLDDGWDVVPFEVELEVVNDAPVAFNVSQAGFVGSDLVVNLSGSDPDDDPLTFQIVAGPAVGSLGAITSTGPASAQVTYSPGAAGPGAQSFTFRVTDGLAFSAPATATIQLQSEAPIATPTNVSTLEDTPVDIVLAGIDQQGDALTFAIASPPSHGSLGAITPLGPYTARVTYTPAPNYNGADLFTFTASDGTFTSSPAVVGIGISPVDDGPGVIGSPVESFTTHTNVTLQVAATRTVTPGVFVVGNLRSNFVDPEGDPLTVALEAGTVTAGASVTMASDGTFTYVPPVGRTADDTFDYTVTDGSTPVTRTVTISFGPAVWFVDDTFGGTATGTSAAPFTSLGAASGASAPGDIVFVRRGNSGTTPLSGGFAFQAGQQLVGEAAGLTTTLGLVAAPSGGARPVLTNAAGAGVTLADGSVLNGFDILTPSGAGIAASGVTGATITAVDVTGPGGPGIDLDAPAGVWTMTSVSVAGAAGAGIDIDGGSATLTSDADVTNTAGRSVEVSGITGGSVTLSGDIDDTGAGIQIDGNTGGTITLSGTTKTVSTGANPGVVLLNNTGAVIDFTGGGLDVDVTSGAGFSATGGGTVTVQGSGNSVSATTGTPVTISATTIGAGGVTLQRVDAAGAANGIVLSGTGGGSFTVTGVGSTDGSGGTITATTGPGVDVDGATDVSLANLIIGDPTAVAGQLPDAVNLVGGSGIVATDLAPGGGGDPGLTLTNVRVARTAGHGLDATRVTGLSITDSEFLNAGDGPGDDALHFGASGGPDGLFGTAVITNTVVDGFIESGLELHNATGSLALTVSGGSFANNQGGAAAGLGLDGVRLVPAGTASITVRVTGVTSFATLAGAGFDLGASASASADVTVENALFSDIADAGGAVRITATGSSGARARVANNTILRATGSGIYFEETGSANLDGTIQDNVVGTPGDATSGALSGNGLSLIHAGTGTSRFLADANVFNNHEAAGIFSLNLESGASGAIDSHVVLTGNTVAAPDAGGIGGIQVATAGDHELCTSVTGNTSAGNATTGIEVQQSGASIFSVEGLVGAVDAFLALVNTSTASSVGGVYQASAGSCATPTAPSVP